MSCGLAYEPRCGGHDRCHNHFFFRRCLDRYRDDDRVDLALGHHLDAVGQLDVVDVQRLALGQRAQVDG